MTNEELPLCLCGCGCRVTKKGNRFIKGHNWRNKSHASETKKKMSDAHTGIPRSPEVCDAISRTLTGVTRPPRTPEHCKAISKGQQESDAIKSRDEAMQGGNDICDHHYIYDHSDPSKYTMKITRSRHQRLHKLMQKAGIKVPHINIKETKQHG